MKNKSLNNTENFKDKRAAWEEEIRKELEQKLKLEIQQSLELEMSEREREIEKPIPVSRNYGVKVYAGRKQSHTSVEHLMNLKIR